VDPGACQRFSGRRKEAEKGHSLAGQDAQGRDSNIGV
jgi:hypothetical protein